MFVITILLIKVYEEQYIKTINNIQNNTINLGTLNIDY